MRTPVTRAGVRVDPADLAALVDVHAVRGRPLREPPHHRVVPHDAAGRMVQPPWIGKAGRSVMSSPGISSAHCCGSSTSDCTPRKLWVLAAILNALMAASLCPRFRLPQLKNMRL